jgi:hypothetical protein
MFDLTRCTGTGRKCSLNNRSALVGTAWQYPTAAIWMAMGNLTMIAFG